jgi:hypothetical protein
MNRKVTFKSRCCKKSGGQMTTRETHRGTMRGNSNSGFQPFQAPMTAEPAVGQIYLLFKDQTSIPITQLTLSSATILFLQSLLASTAPIDQFNFLTPAKLQQIVTIYYQPLQANNSSTRLHPSILFRYLNNLSNFPIYLTNHGSPSTLPRNNPRHHRPP